MKRRGIIKILAVGDVVGRPGRQAVRRLIPALRKERQIDLVMVNAENAAGGSGVTPAIADELLDYQVDVLTSGDHIWKRREIIPYLDGSESLLRPANYPEGTPGKGAAVVKTGSGQIVGVINLLGRVYMQSVDCPFLRARAEMEKLREITPVIIVDIHAEATSEKLALGWFLDGKVSAVVGTHTHVQTADEKVLPKGTAYLTDLGMTGPQSSILGRKVEQIIKRFLTAMPVRFEMAEEDVELQGAIIELNSETGRALSIERVKTKLV